MPNSSPVEHHPSLLCYLYLGSEQESFFTNCCVVFFFPLCSHSFHFPHTKERPQKDTTAFSFPLSDVSFEDFAIYWWSGGKAEFSKMQTFLKRPVSPLAAPASNDLPTESISV